MTDQETLARELFTNQFERLDGAVDHLIGSVILLNAGQEAMGHAMSYESTLAHIVTKAAAALHEIQCRKDAADSSHTEPFDSTPSALMAILMFPYVGGGERKRSTPRRPDERATIPL